MIPHQPLAMTRGIQRHGWCQVYSRLSLTTALIAINNAAPQK